MDDEDDDKLDLSALDPAADRPAWERRIAAIAARGVAMRRPIRRQMAAWALPALALAAAVAIIVWWTAPPAPTVTAPAETPRARDPASTLASWASSDRLPGTAELLFTLGGADGDR